MDHLDTAQVGRLVDRIRSEQGRLDVLVNDIFGGDRYAEWGGPLWEHDLHGGLRMLRMGIDTHLITSTLAIPLMLDGDGALVVEVTDGPSEVNATRRPGVGFYYDLVKATVDRIVAGLAAETAETPVTALGVTPGWLRSETMLDNFGVTEATWSDACRDDSRLRDLRVTGLRRPGCRGARRGPTMGPVRGPGADSETARRHLRGHRRRRDTSRLLGSHRGPRVG